MTEVSGVPIEERTEPSGAVARLRRLMAHDRVRATVHTMLSVGLKGFAAVSIAVAFVFASHAMDAKSFGQLTIWFNVISFVSVFAALGQDGLVVRLWNEHVSAGEHGLARGAWRFGWLVVVLGAATAAIAVATVARVWFGTGVGETIAGAAFLCTASIGFYAMTTCRNICGPLVASSLAELPWRLAMLIATGVCVLRGVPVTATLFFGMAALGGAFGIAGQLALQFRHFPAAVSTAAVEVRPRRWLRLSGGLILPAMLEAAAQYAEVILIGLLIDPVSAGAYFAAQRIAAVFPMLSTGVQNYTVGYAPRLYFEGRKDELRMLLRHAMRIMTGLAVLALLGVATLGPFLLGLFATGSDRGYDILVLLAAGYTITALAGPAGTNLLLTGHERTYLRLQSGMLALRFVAVLVLTHLFGAVGTALAVALIALPTGILLVMAHRRLIGADPSIAGLFAAEKTPGG